jgi:hypothetical protein
VGKEQVEGTFWAVNIAEALGSHLGTLLSKTGELLQSEGSDLNN